MSSEEFKLTEEQVKAAANLLSRADKHAVKLSFYIDEIERFMLILNCIAQVLDKEET